MYMYYMYMYMYMYFHFQVSDYNTLPAPPVSLGLVPGAHVAGRLVRGIEAPEVGREVGRPMLGRILLAGRDDLGRALGPVSAVLLERVRLLLALDRVAKDVLGQLLEGVVVARELVAADAAEHLALAVPSGVADHERRLVHVAPLRRLGQALGRRVREAGLRGRLVRWQRGDSAPHLRDEVLLAALVVDVVAWEE